MGVVQGLTEFLPVSSSAHLVIIQSLFHLNKAASILAFDVALHFGTLLAVIFVFRRDLLLMIREGASGTFGVSARLALLVIVATLPAAVVGLCFKHRIETLFVSPKVAGFGLIVTGTVLWLTKGVLKQTKGEKEATFRDALLVGIAQSVAITPGISRSGSTMATGLFRHFDQVFAARFSFLMAIPAILGSVVLEAKELKDLQGSLLPVFMGVVAAAITGFLSIQWLLRIIGRGRLYLFSYYCWIVGVATVIFI